VEGSRPRQEALAPALFLDLQRHCPFLGRIKTLIRHLGPFLCSRLEFADRKKDLSLLSAILA